MKFMFQFVPAKIDHHISKYHTGLPAYSDILLTVTVNGSKFVSPHTKNRRLE